METILRLVLVPVLLLLLAFFVAAELALVRLRPTLVEALKQRHRRAALVVQRLQRQMQRVLVTTQLGSCLCLLALGWSSHSLAVLLVPGEQVVWSDLTIFLLLALLATLLGGLLPKALVLHRTETAALRLSPLLAVVLQLLAPLLALVERLSTLLLGRFGLPRDWLELAPAFSAEELETLIETDKVTGLAPDERQILEGAFSLRDTCVREVMVPRNGMVTLPRNIDFQGFMQAVDNSNHARFPVIDDSLDNVCGLLDLRRLATPIARSLLTPPSAMAPYIEPITRILETASLAELLQVIRNGQPLLLVVDEHGGTEGLVTLSDLTGEIVGEDDPAEDDQSPDILVLEQGRWIVAGDAEIVEVNRQLGLELPESDDHHTLAGFLLETLQHIPSPGESLHWQGIQCVVLSMAGPRIVQVEMLDRHAGRESADLS